MRFRPNSYSSACHAPAAARVRSSGGPDVGTPSRGTAGGTPSRVLRFPRACRTRDFSPAARTRRCSCPALSLMLGTMVNPTRRSVPHASAEPAHSHRPAEPRLARATVICSQSPGTSAWAVALVVTNCLACSIGYGASHPSARPNRDRVKASTSDPRNCEGTASACLCVVRYLPRWRRRLRPSVKFQV